MNNLLDAFFLPLNIVAWAAFLGVGAVMVKKWVPPAQMGGPFISIGILFTFAGILAALLGFDTNDLEGSVPTLLDGMKTAFLSSVVGMGLAILTRVYAIVTSGEDGPSGPTGEQFFAEMRSQKEMLEKIEKGMGGDGDHSVLTQLRLANGTMTALKVETAGMRTDLRTFAEKLSEQSTDAIITALQNVIRDFNTQLNEQFGDNFKQLNQGVERLVDWMDKHEKLITASHKALHQATETLSKASESLQSSAASMTQLDQASGSVLQTTQDTSEALLEANTLLQLLSGDMASLAVSTDSLQDAVTKLSTANEALSKGLEAWNSLAGESRAATGKIQGMVRSVEKHASAVTQQHGALISKLGEQTQAMAADIKTAQASFFKAQEAEMTAAVKKQGDTLTEAHRKVMVQAQQDLKTSGERNHETIERQVQALDSALEEELSKSLQAIGGKLASLSEKFAEDYRPLTVQLARVVRLAEDIERQRGAHRG